MLARDGMPFCPSTYYHREGVRGDNSKSFDDLVKPNSSQKGKKFYHEEHEAHEAESKSRLISS
jgi:hypothetical protein